MGVVYTAASMSLDGYIAGPDEQGFAHLFSWYANGPQQLPTANPEVSFHMSEASAAHFRELADRTGALVVGRRQFDLTGGWGGQHPLGVPVVVLTHRLPDEWPRAEAPFVFRSGHIESALAQAKALAGRRAVGVSAGSVARQVLNARLLDEVWIELVPVLLGGGTPYLSELSRPPVLLEGPIAIAAGHGVTHLRYRVRRA
ncbi:dihydrofolate reductase family protein [Natronosporangium hydrolyticum]|uniref:Dihydrofolate reductase family protein n=1 Tax=Natronosporangium hydrolyticum TaxID=2811111 RepID=A0A895YEZ2_9ACTN|nr:dihydrofolate reductase family protein [Natronosporangium hydrolyticum]QSB12780.1 dihydrofolate reductase family protein [Natronosporangium hydrolyticum]